MSTITMSDFIIVVLWVLLGGVGIVIAWQGMQEKLEQRDLYRDWLNKYGRPGEER